ncbi:unnamed protein product [Porites lobata]|uniref:Zinc finger GRF-type domain-containing protein n=1 Tax=Porites lobata TaxID=104759 RepID=A0ABN8N8I2_9CNID|nr:unnamed protein product [Porites lobata]
MKCELNSRKLFLTKETRETASSKKRGTCKYLQKDVAEPATTYWIGCEFPGCGYWRHEVCMGIKFKSKTERDKYSFI